jgi:signal transduction histidine kinase/CheY-like chemotaxis protein
LAFYNSLSLFLSLFSDISFKAFCKEILPAIAILVLIAALCMFFLVIPIAKKKIANLKRISIERFGSFLNESRYYVIIFNMHGNPLYVNKAFCDYWKLDSKGEMLFLKEYNIFEDKALIGMQFENDIKRAFKGSSVTLPNFMYSLKESNDALFFVDQKKMWTRMHFYPVKDESGSIIEIVMLIDNISDHMNSEVEKIKLIYELEVKNSQLNSTLLKADEANRLKTEFLAVMSHELRTPVSAMLGFSQLLLNDKLLNSSQKENIEYINKSADSLLSVLNDVLEISIIEAGKLELKYENINIRQIVEEVYLLFKDTFDKKRILFEADFNGIETIVSVEARLRQILFNILGNAAKFTHQGYVWFNVEKKDEKYIISVKDTGIGIAEKNQEIIFDIFRQVEGNLNRSFYGTGVGLSICRRLIEALEGRIWLESEEGNGSTFYFEIPSNKTAGYTKVYRDNNALKKENLSPKASILFAEDDELNRNLLTKALLKNKNYSVKAVSNGAEVIDELEKNPEYSIIILDIRMPVMDGIECLCNIRKFNKSIPVIAVSAYAGYKETEKYLDMGFSDYMPKPLSEDEMMKRIDKFVISLNPKQTDAEGPQSMPPVL